MNLELLETRLTPTTFHYTDVDGDAVTIALTGNAAIFADTDPLGSGEQCKTIQITGGIAASDKLTVSVVKKPGGDGLANVGRIIATGYDLAAVSVVGDVGRIDVGDADLTTPALGLFKVRSLGAYGLVTGADSLVSIFTGSVGAFSVTRNVQDAFVQVVGGGIGILSIGGSLIGGGVASAGNLQVTGGIGAIRIGGSVVGGTADYSGRITANGPIGSISIGGSLVGGAGSFSGEILVPIIADIGSVKIHGNLQGGDKSNSGLVLTYGSIGGASIGGSLLGGLGSDSGSVQGVLGIGNVTVGRDVVGGADKRTGFIGAIGADAPLGNVTIGGSLVGAGGPESGKVFSHGDMGFVKVRHEVRGGLGNGSGVIATSTGRLAGLTVGRSLTGGAGPNSGRVYADDGIGPIKVAGNLVGGAGTPSGNLESNGDIASITIGGSLIGGDGYSESGYVHTNGDLGPVKIGGDIRGGSNASAIGHSGEINSGGGIASITVRGSLFGGATPRGGTIISDDAVGPIKIGGSIIGGSGESTGKIYGSNLDPLGIKSLTVGGSIIGGSGSSAGGIHSEHGFQGALRIGGDLVGGSGGYTGTIASEGGAPTIALAGSVIGGSGRQSGQVVVFGNVGQIVIGGDLMGGANDSAGSIAVLSSAASIAIGGNIISGAGGLSGSIQLGIQGSTDARLGALTVRGGIFGSAANPVNIEVLGKPSPANEAEALAIQSVSIGGDVRFARILAGHAINGITNPDVQIGAMTVGGDWIASSLAAGVRPNDGISTDTYFGNAGDSVIPGGNPAIVSKIGSVLIKGIVVGSPDSASDHFGFVAQQIGSFKSLGFTAALTPATDLPLELALTTGDVTIRELA